MTDRENNPFEEPEIAKQWIKSSEGEQGMIRDRELYPYLKVWSQKHKGVLVDIGAGQVICSSIVQHDGMMYIGVEPSQTLIDRANEKYSGDKRRFVLGNAYDLPVEDSSVDIVLSVNVWFHLRDLTAAAREVSRILKSDGVFLISTANPKSYPYWEKRFDENAKITDKIIEGKVNTPVQSLSRNIFYKYTMEELLESFESNGLTIEKITEFGNEKKFSPGGLFINFEGKKI